MRKAIQTMKTRKRSRTGRAKTFLSFLAMTMLMKAESSSGKRRLKKRPKRAKEMIVHPLKKSKLNLNWLKEGLLRT